jgi:RHS repeat-associated protein
MGEVRRYVNRRGQAVTAAYDSLLRRTVRQGTNLIADTLEYSANGRVTTASGAKSIETVYLNKRGQPDSVKTVFRSDLSKKFWRRYTYDTRARLTSVASTGGAYSFQTRSYTYSANGLLGSMQFGTPTTSFGYNSDRRREVTTLPGTSHTIAQEFSTVHSPIERASVAMDEKYRFDVTHRMDLVFRESIPSLERNFYDGLGRLDSVRFVSEGFLGLYCYDVQWDDGWTCYGGSLDSTHAFAYDSVGNRKDHGGGYATGNRITAFDGCAYGTDYDGNVTSRVCSGDTVSLAWDALNRLASVTRNGNATDLYYNGFNRLVHIVDGGVPVRYFLWDRDNPYAEINVSDWVVLAEYSHYPGLDQPHAMRLWQPGGSYATVYAHTDGKGNVVAVTDSDKHLKRSYVYDEWGQLVGGLDSLAYSGAQRARFKGALWIGAGADLYYMRNRWYEPKTGRFLNEDPIGLIGGMNRYEFAESDPVNGRDPSGLCWWCPATALGGAILGGYAAHRNGGDIGDIAVGALVGGMLGFVGGFAPYLVEQVAVAAGASAQLLGLEVLALRVVGGASIVGSGLASDALGRGIGRSNRSRGRSGNNGVPGGGGGTIDGGGSGGGFDGFHTGGFKWKNCGTDSMSYGGTDSKGEPWKVTVTVNSCTGSVRIESTPNTPPHGGNF